MCFPCFCSHHNIALPKRNGRSEDSKALTLFNRQYAYLSEADAGKPVSEKEVLLSQASSAAEAAALLSRKRSRKHFNQEGPVIGNNVL